MLIVLIGLYSGVEAHLDERRKSIIIEGVLGVCRMNLEIGEQFFILLKKNIFKRRLKIRLLLILVGYVQKP